MVSPSTSCAAVAAKRLSRECMVLAAVADFGSPLRPLPDGTSLEELYAHVHGRIRPLVLDSRAGKLPLTSAAAAACLLTSAATRVPMALHAASKAAPASPERGEDSSFTSPPVPPRRATAQPPLRAGAPTGGAVPDGVMSRIVSAVKTASGVPDLSEEQLRAILALSASAASAAADAHTAAADAHGAAADAIAFGTPTAATPLPATSKATLATAADLSAGALPCAASLATATANALTAEVLATPGTLHYAMGVPLASAIASSRALPPSGATEATPVVGQPAPPAKPSAAGSKRWGELHVALWDRVKRQRIASTAYKGDLVAYLRENPHLEVYNRQDVCAGKPGGVAPNAPRAGTKLCTATPVDGGSKEPRVVLWDTARVCKVPVAEAPTQSQLHTYLRAHPHVEVYAGQQSPCGASPLVNFASAPSQLKRTADGELKVTPAAAASRRAPAGRPFISFAKAKPLVKGFGMGGSPPRAPKLCSEPAPKGLVMCAPSSVPSPMPVPPGL